MSAKKKKWEKRRGGFSTLSLLLQDWGKKKKTPRKGGEEEENPLSAERLVGQHVLRKFRSDSVCIKKKRLPKASKGVNLLYPVLRKRKGHIEKKKRKKWPCRKVTDA